MLITEWHTSDLTSRCTKRVQLKHMGKAIPEVASAMFRGLLIHHHLQCWHEDRAADLYSVLDSIKKEGRTLTTACAAAVQETNEEAKTIVGYYAQRYGAFFKQCKLLGCEVPLRWNGIDVDGKPADFATHIDLLYKDPNGLLCADDWKSGDTDWDGEHSSRSMQFGMTFMALQYGHAMLDGEWIDLQEAPHVRVVDVDALKPYSRRTMGKKDGEDYEYVKGDVRPESSVSWDMLMTNESGILEQFATRVRMARANLWPMNPTDKGCRACECRKACPTWTSDEKEKDDGTL
jgi:hypothetical protein